MLELGSPGLPILPPHPAGSLPGCHKKIKVDKLSQYFPTEAPTAVLCEAGTRPTRLPAQPALCWAYKAGTPPSIRLSRLLLRATMGLPLACLVALCLALASAGTQELRRGEGGPRKWAGGTSVVGRVLR